MGLSSHVNVYNTCLLLLRARGFALHVEGELDEDGMIPIDKFWVATKDGFVLNAANPIELLGLAAIHEHKQPVTDEPYWWVVEGDDVCDELYEAAWGPFDDD